MSPTLYQLHDPNKNNWSSLNVYPASTRCGYRDSPTIHGVNPSNIRQDSYHAKNMRLSLYFNQKKTRRDYLHFKNFGLTCILFKLGQKGHVRLELWSPYWAFVLSCHLNTQPQRTCWACGEFVLNFYVLDLRCLWGSYPNLYIEIIIIWSRSIYIISL